MILTEKRLDAFHFMNLDGARLLSRVGVGHAGYGVRLQAEEGGKLTLCAMRSPGKLLLKIEAEFVLRITHTAIFAIAANFPIAKFAKSS
ncbi:hypothetical protein EN810_07630 [Mesorhizobium sp. M8A.F.Ca.ET.167.01.1.1]|nr:hypothetical protein EN810_07630 [Mesorhizobium sp. M8A.F.Ca.ET.167.01.1.1]